MVSKDILKSNFFELFHLPVSYDVDLDQIQQHYMDLQKQVHPDKFASASDQEKRLSMQQTSWINEAQATLKDPVLRANYLLQLKGADKDQGSETTMDTAFLMQQLEMRERLENINNEPDPLVVLDAMAKEIKLSKNTMMAGFTASYEADQFEDAREWIRKLQFLKKAAKEIDALAADIEDELMS
jgi:molecular chaperone HscB